MFVCVSVGLQTIRFELNDISPIYLVCWFILRLSIIGKFEGHGHMSKFTGMGGNSDANVISATSSWVLPFIVFSVT